MIRQCTSIIEYYIHFKSLWTCNYKAINNIIPHLASNNNKFLFLHSSSFGSMRSMATACSSAPYISIQKSAFGAKTVLKQTQLVSFKKAATIKLRSSFKTKVNTNYLLFFFLLIINFNQHLLLSCFLSLWQRIIAMQHDPIGSTLVPKFPSY